MRGRIAVGLLAALLWAGPLAAQPVPSAPVSASEKWGPFIDFEGKAGTKRNIGEADVFLPLWQDNRSLLFGNVRARLDDNDSHEGNFGAGFRHMLESGWNLGLYGYFDRRRSENLNYYNQVTVGAEALSLDWDGRFNAYIPEGRRTHEVDAFNTAEVSGTSVLFHDGEEKSLRGFDAEIGWRTPLFTPEALQQLRLYAGGYTFYADGINNRVQGPRGRIEFTAEETPYLWEGSRLTLGTEVQNDGPRGTQAFFLARLRVPLQFWDTPKAAQLTPMERRMTDRIVRDVDIVSQAGNFGAVETATTTSGGTLVGLNGFSATNLNSQLTAAGANATVVLSGTFNTSASSTLLAGQNLMAGTLTVRSASGRTTTLTTSATINGTVNSGANGAVIMANNSTVSGLTITNTGSGGGGIAISANNVTGITIANNVLTATDATNAAAALFATNASTGTISGNTLSATGVGVNTSAVLLNAGTFTVSGNSFSATESGGPAGRTINLQNNPTINAGSTGNTLVRGSCSGTTASGSIGLAGGATCP